LLQDVPAERPYYTALARAVRGLVLEGRLPLRVRLPAERDLATVLGVSRTTITAVYDVLRAEGFIESRQGSGSWTTLPPNPMTAPEPGRFGSAHPPARPQDIDLGCAAPAAPRIFEEAVAAAVAELPRYTPGFGYEPAGLIPLRESIADRYTERGLATRPDQIVVTTGAQHALTLLMQTLVNAGDTVLVESPTYPRVLDAVRHRGARLVPAGVNRGWDVELIASSLRQTAVRLAYTIPDFQNPTGHLMSDAERGAFVDAARRADCHVVADETFAELAIDPPAVPPPLAAYDSGGRVISVGSADKLFWGGLRIGWIRTTSPIARRLTIAREAIDIASPVLEQLIARELLARMGEVRAERSKQLGESRDALAGALRATLPDWEFTLPQGGMSLWARLPAPVATVLAEAALRRGVRVVPGPAFGTDGVLDDYLRLPYVLPPQVLLDAVGRLHAAYRDIDNAPPARALPAYV
jgi:DNA-binding transcriptional MocR family regulator